MRGSIISLLCVVCVLATIVAFGHWGLQEDTHPLVAARFTDNGDGTVTDKTTGLIWLKNAKCFGALTWDEAMTAAVGLADGQCGLTDGSSAGDWHLPERAALLTLIDERYQYPALSNEAGTDHWREGDPFSGVQSDYYWSSTTYAYNPYTAWLVFFGHYYVYYDSVYFDRKICPHYVWPVRSGQENIGDVETF
jgi:hypothetical protein